MRVEHGFSKTKKGGNCLVNLFSAAHGHTPYEDIDAYCTMFLLPAQATAQQT